MLSKPNLFDIMCFGLTCLDNQLIILCCANRRAIIKGSVGKGVSLVAFIAKAYASKLELLVIGYILVRVVLVSLVRLR
jgi:hypothetical protein